MRLAGAEYPSQKSVFFHFIDKFIYHVISRANVFRVGPVLLEELRREIQTLQSGIGFGRKDLAVIAKSLVELFSILLCVQASHRRVIHKRFTVPIKRLERFERREAHGSSARLVARRLSVVDSK